MIRINDDWVVDVDEYNYALKKDLHKEVPRKERDGSVTMVHQYKTCGYFSTLQHALNRLLDEMVVERLSDGEISLNEYFNHRRNLWTYPWRQATREEFQWRWMSEAERCS